MISDFFQNWTLHLNLLAEIVGVLLVTTMISYGVYRLLNYLKGSQKVHYLLRTLGDSLYTSSQWFIWGYSAIVILSLLIGHFDYLKSKFDLDQIRRLYFAIGLFWLVIIWKNHTTGHFVRKAAKNQNARYDKALINALSRISTIGIIVMASFVILEIFHVPVAGLLASGAVGGIAISLAGKDVISNFFGGLMIYIHRHFVVGDWIKSPNKGFEGVVENIGWYLTQIRTFERRPLFIPNSVITDAIIENPSRMYNRRIKHDIGIRYSDMKIVGPIVKDIEKMLKSHPAIDQEQYLMVDMMEFGSYSVKISVYCFTKTTEWQQWRNEQQDVLLKIGEIIAAHGAEIAFPTNTVHLQSENVEASSVPSYS
jgi:MscS family membrane protein